MKQSGIRDKIENYIEKYEIKKGTILTLNGYTRTCCNIKDDHYGTRYVFDDGIGWTKSNIVSNIVKCVTDGNEWQLI